MNARLQKILFSILLITLFVGKGWVQPNLTFRNGSPTGEGASYYTIVNNTVYSVSLRNVVFSTNYGSSWQILSSFPYGAYNIIADSHQRIFIQPNATPLPPVNGLFRSSDFGLHWDWIAHDTDGYFFNIIYSSPNDTLFGLVNSFQMVVSSDSGNHWHLRYTFPFINNILPVTDSTILSAIETTNGDSGEIARSTDGGYTWHDVFHNRGGIGKFVKGVGQNVYANSYSDIYYSSNLGLNWSYQSTVVGQIMDYRETGNTLYLTTFLSGWDTGLVEKSTNHGANWSILPVTLYTGPGGIACFNSDTVVVSNSGTNRTTDGGLTWQQQLWIYGRSISNIVFHQNKIYLCGNLLGGIYESSDNGINWRSYYAGLTSPAGATEGITSLAFDSSRHAYASGLLGLMGNGLYISNDTGHTWQITTSIPEGPELFYGIFCPDSNNVYTLAPDHGTYHSTDHGQTWQRIDNNTSFPRFYSPYGLYVDSQSTVYVAAAGVDSAAYESAVYRTTNNGLSWSSIGYFWNLVNCIYVDRNDIFYAATNDGVFRYNPTSNRFQFLGSRSCRVSNLTADPSGHLYAIYTPSFQGHDFKQIARWNSDTSWTILYSDSTNRYIYQSMQFDEAGYLYVGTDGNGLLRSETPFVSVNRPDRLLPVTSTITCYPNPFNSTTTILYSLPRPGITKLEVFDLLGRNVGTLVNSTQSAGTYRVRFDGKNLSSGSYFYRLSAGGTQETKKFLLVK